MDQRRFTSFLFTALLFTLLWGILGPQLFPGLFPKRKPQPAAEQPAVVDGDKVDAVAPVDVADLPAFDSQQVVIGAQDATDESEPYRIQVTLDTAGAAIQSVALNGKKLREATDRDKPIQVVGNNDEQPPAHTFALLSDDLDAALKASGKTLATVDWEVVQDSLTDESVSFRYPHPSGLELVKSYRVEKSNNRSDANSYIVSVDLAVKNTGENAVTLDYGWQGPVGAPLEHKEYARTFVEIKGGFLPDANDDNGVSVESYTADKVIDEFDNEANGGEKDLKDWQARMKWVGVDVQFFAGLVLAGEGQPALDFIERVRPVVVERRPFVSGFLFRGTDNSWGDVSVVLEAEPVVVPPGGEVTHSLRGYFGPKDKDVLEQIHAGDTITFGWFGWISRFLLGVLGFFHDTIGMPYALAIVMLTVSVRLCMSPITLRAQTQAKRMSQKQKDLQPKIEALKKKHGDDQEALQKAQMELMMQEGILVGSLAGCLPMFLQMPIFIGLYQGLYNAFDLRLGRFLWVDDLAAPDHLADFPFDVPLLGTWFNLLPILVITLFILQQKLFMPEATTDEQRSQQKIMKWMMVAMGFLFYKSPAGLCLYFIASSLWGITERKAIDKGWIKLPQKKEADPNAPKKEPLLKRLLGDKWDELAAAAEAAREQQQGQKSAQIKNNTTTSTKTRREPQKSSTRGKRGKKKR